jgi:FG-GAP repeat protein
MALIRSSFLLALLSSSALGAQVGTVQSARKINDAHGGFTGVLADDDYFGLSVTSLGDLDGDGLSELAVGAPWSGNGGEKRGTVWILFLASDGSVRRHVRITEGSGGFTDVLPDLTLFGYAVAGMGDLDGDGVPDLAVTAHGSPGTQWPGALWILFLARDGTIARQARTETSDPIYVPRLRDDFGYSLTNLGDIDGDGVNDLAVGTPYDDEGPGNDGGAVWILRLRADGSPHGATKISQVAGGFGHISNLLGGSMAAIGDLDGDGHTDLACGSGNPQPLGSTWIFFLDAQHEVGRAVQLMPADVGLPGDKVYYQGSLGDLDGDGLAELLVATTTLTNHGAFTLNFLGPTGKPRKSVLVAEGVDGLSGLEEAGLFGISSARLGDLDKDGTLEIAVGAPYDSELGEDHGAVWILSLDLDPARSGCGNAAGALVQKADPALGASWFATLDCTAQGPGLARLLWSDAALPGSTTPAGDLLVDLSPGHALGALVVATASGPAGVQALFEARIPREATLIDRRLHVQGLCTGPRGLRLSNALDLVVVR